MRRGIIKRTTAETDVYLELDLDGTGKADVATGIGFLDHMLILLAKHGFLDLTVKAKGDLNVDSHHTMEDCGICLGLALKEALGDKAGIHRYGECLLPMDETLMQVALDFSGRPYFAWQVDIPKVKLGTMDAEMAEEFFRAVCTQCGLTLHIREIAGANVHHKIEAVFKAFARSLAMAVAKDARVQGVMSSKGVL